MKLRLSVKETNREYVSSELTAHGIEISEDAEYSVTESPGGNYLTVKDSKGDKVRIACNDIVYIESYGRNVDVHTTDGSYRTQERIYQLEEFLDKSRFTRVSNSVIVQKKHIKKIRPSLSMKFIITMSEGTVIDVTRSYYSSFRSFLGI